MGARLNLAAYRFAEAAQLHDQPTRLLGYMASVALDTAAVPLYYAGVEASARALGKNPATSSRLVAKVVATLVASGAIAHHKKGRRGSNAVYRLTFPVEESGASSVPLTGTQSEERMPATGTLPPEIASHSGAERVPLTGRKGATDRHPEEEEEKEEEGRVRARDADDGFSLDTPASPPPPDSPFCIHHPGGTTAPCYGCGQARKAYEATHGKTPRRPRSPRPASTTPALVHVDGRDVCADGRHKLTADAKSCILCQIRPEDLAAQLAESAIA
ncbi:hypothetical protein [Microbacterium enclense]|uniref:hypothetical protein n=1 Tax=Microbacterium enclense TaxID=993073 RepID=UPI003D76354E